MTVVSEDKGCISLLHLLEVARVNILAECAPLGRGWYIGHSDIWGRNKVLGMMIFQSISTYFLVISYLIAGLPHIWTIWKHLRGARFNIFYNHGGIMSKLKSLGEEMSMCSGGNK